MGDSGGHADDAVGRPSAPSRPVPTGRKRILEVALGEFAARGFDGASLAEIARLAGVTQPLVHYHFATKDDLWKEVVREAFAELGRHGIDDTTGLRDLQPLDRLRVAFRRYVNFVAAHPELGRIVSHEGSSGGERLAWMVDEELGGRLRAMAQLVQDGIDAGAVKDLPAEFVAVSFIAAAGYVFQVGELMERVWGIDVTDEATIDRFADTLATAFLDGVLTTGQREPARA